MPLQIDRDTLAGRDVPEAALAFPVHARQNPWSL
jgi:hypothetical protein